MDDSLRTALAVWEALGDETFRFTCDDITYLWNVSKAKRILAEDPHDLDRFRPADQGVTADHLNGRYPTLDWEYAKTTDLSEPLIFVPFDGACQLIDGFHRLAHAVLEGVPELPAYLLTQEEADACLIARLPECRKEKEVQT